MPETDPQPFTATITIPAAPRADELAAELRKMRDALGRAYRNALLGHDLPIWHPAMQGVAAASINLECVIQALDPPKVMVPGAGQIIPGAGRA